VTSWLGKVFFGKYDRAVRRQHVRWLGVALLLALMICLVFGVLLFLLNQQGRL
jgi:hypothetical protein